MSWASPASSIWPPQANERASSEAARSFLMDVFMPRPISTHHATCRWAEFTCEFSRAVQNLVHPRAECAQFLYSRALLDTPPCRRGYLPTRLRKVFFLTGGHRHEETHYRVAAVHGRVLRRHRRNAQRR